MINLNQIQLNLNKTNKTPMLRVKNSLMIDKYYFRCMTFKIDTIINKVFLKTSKIVPLQEFSFILNVNRKKKIYFLISH